MQHHPTVTPLVTLVCLVMIPLSQCQWLALSKQRTSVNNQGNPLDLVIYKSPSHLLPPTDPQILVTHYAAIVIRMATFSI